MTIYVDAPVGYNRRGNRVLYGNWCHMMTDGDIEELHKFAHDILGLKREWFQYDPVHPHYDLLPGTRRYAVINGAVEVSAKEMLRICVMKGEEK